GQKFSVQGLLEKEMCSNTFVNETLDYHHFHVPVNPIAVNSKYCIVFTENKQVVSIISTVNFGKVVFVAIGATMVDSITFTRKKGDYVKKGDGNSIAIDEDLLANIAGLLAEGKKSRRRPKKHGPSVIVEMTNRGVDRSVECTGSIKAMISAFEYVHDGWGVAILVGMPIKDDVFKTHPMNFLNERTLKGTFYGNYKPRTNLPNVVEKYMKGELELEKFITHTVPFPEINKPFNLMLKGESIKCIIRMDE
ncbi:hypothetical protein S245_016007, partial [Arachis hypogaea]